MSSANTIATSNWRARNKEVNRLIMSQIKEHIRLSTFLPTFHRVWADKSVNSRFYGICFAINTRILSSPYNVPKS